jgi:NADPH-dependent 2,4-dienoyl-CoA reductase/sulfur reductase-like enzyme
LLKTKKIIIIGGNAAGPSAAAKAKRTDPSADVKLFEAGNFISTGTCELPYLLAGEIKDYKGLVFFSPETFQSEKGVEVYVNHVVKSINKKKKTITVTKLEDKSVKEYEYDKLILTTGAVAKKLPVFSGEFENVLTLKSVGDYLKIKSWIEKTSVKNIVIIGAGYIGIETAESFKELGYNVAIIEKSDEPMPALDKETSLLIFDVLKKNDVKFYGGVADFSIVKNGNRITEIKFGENNIETDLILSAVGFRPNNNLGIGANLKTGGFGGLVVDKRLRTSDPDIFAAGDNIEVINKITGTPDYIPLATIAHEFGHIAGENASGGDAFSNSVVKNISVKVFDKVLSAVD